MTSDRSPRLPLLLLLALAAGCGTSGDADGAAWAEIRAFGAPPNLTEVALRVHYTELVPVAERVLAASPDEVREANATALDAIRAVAATGDAAEFAAPPVRAARDELAAYAYEHCRRR